MVLVGRVSMMAVALVGASLIAGCRAPDLTPPVARAIEQIVARPPDAVGVAVWHDVQQFYAGRTHRPAWTLDDVRAGAVLDALRRAPEHGLVTGDYLPPDLPRLLRPEKGSIADALDRDATKLATLDVRVTTALLALGRDVAIGRTSPTSIDARWKARRSPPDLPGALAKVAAGEDSMWPDAVRPVHPEYAALQRALASLRTPPGSETPDEELLRRLALNLERWRWLPDDLGDRHVLVNVPAFHLAVREHGQPVLDMKVVVGKPDRTTPIFSATMATVVFSPYWNVPDSIAEGETAPAAARDPKFLSRNQIEVLRRGSGGDAVVDPASVDWNDPDAIKSLAFRQKPGANNALGHVKFLFPNPYDVYLHDTPADALFSRQGRAFSHGCVRLEQPEALAKYVLRDRPEWDDEKIQAAMNRGTEQHVALADKMPVHIVYFTVWPRGDHGVDSWPDVYGYDARQASSPPRRDPGRPTSSARAH